MKISLGTKFLLTELRLSSIHHTYSCRKPVSKVSHSSRRQVLGLPIYTIYQNDFHDIKNSGFVFALQFMSKRKIIFTCSLTWLPWYHSIRSLCKTLANALDESFSLFDCFVIFKALARLETSVLWWWMFCDFVKLCLFANKADSHKDFTRHLEQKHKIIKKIITTLLLRPLAGEFKCRMWPLADYMQRIATVS